MTETTIIKLLKNQQLSKKALVEKVEAFTKEEQSELDALLTHLQASGIVGLHNNFYFLLSDQKIFLAKVTFKNRNFVVLRSVSDGSEVRLSGEEADQLLIGDLVYAKEFQQNTYHCLDYYKATDTLKGRYSITKDGKEQLLVDYLNACGKTVLIDGIADGLKVNQGDLLEGKIRYFKGDTLKVTITSLLVRADDVGSDISMIISENDGRFEFPQAVLDEAKAIPQEISEEDLKGREDFRDHCVVTIDGDDAHDFDDAVEIERDGNGYLIRVHIADVTHYVRTNHPLDDEAKLRCTSIYVADRVVPMLPFELSNGICSLNPNVDRLVLTCSMEVDAMGHVFSSKVQRGVIRSHGRLTYNQVNQFFEGQEVPFSQEIKDSLTLMREAAKAIRRRRDLQGAMKLDSTELKFHLDENGMPDSVTKQVQGEAEKMIEDMMIIANCSVAKELKRAHIPVLYRIHEFPPSDKISTLRDFLKRAGLIASFPRTENISGARLNDFLASIKDDNLRSAVSYMVLRSMAKARYSPEELGHFGLAELEYCHFTSPIRRYPDDIIHRLVKDYLLDKKPFDYDELTQRLEDQGDALSDLEVKADYIERESDDLESAKYMSTRIGTLYHAKVMSLVQRGMFLETDIGIEGFLPYHCMHGDYFHYDERSFAAYGEKTEVSFTIGTPIDVKVLSVDIDKREIDFATPEFYDSHALNLSEEEKEDLARNGIRVYTKYEDVPLMTGKPRFTNEEEENEDYGERETMEPKENDQNVLDALDAMDAKEKEVEEDNFRPTPEQWKEVDVIRAVVAKYPDDEAKVLQVLAVMDIDEAEYRKLLRFTKPREEKHSRSSRGGRSFGGKGSFHRGGGFDHRGGGRSFGDRDHKGSFSHGDKKDFKSSRRPRKDFADHQGYASLGKKSSDDSYERRDRKSYGSRSGSYGKRDSYRSSATRKPMVRKGKGRSGYGRKKHEED
ncbi:MAG: ribonuclease R [Eubacteriales bacterium]|nr:ribonuclease R [Eubacteriales bacterium]